MHLSRYVYYLFLMLMTLTWTSCQTESRNSVLVIAVDHLPADQILCYEDNSNDKSGLKVLCKESVRFTHGYTTSTQPAAAVGSLLTGLYPIDHELYRSFDRLKSPEKLVSKTAKENNYSTAFFSGSPFILKKTGLSHYFDLFDDSIASSRKDFFQDFQIQTEQFFNWQHSIRGVFFSVIYSSELKKITDNETDLNSFEKWDEKLFYFLEKLKQKKLWDKTYIILVGINGSNRFNRLNLNSFTNLHNENTNVALLIKTPRAKGDEGVQWKSDYPVSLADVGKTLHCLFKKCDQSTSNQFFATYDLSPLIEANEKEDVSANFTHRAILIQSSSSFDSKYTQHGFSILNDNYNLIMNAQDNSIQIFNQLTDKGELTDINNYSSYKDVEEQNSKYINYLKYINNVRTITDDEVETLSQINYKYWLENNFSIDSIHLLNKYNPLTYFFLQKNLNNKTDKNIQNHISDLKNDILLDKSCSDLIFKNLSKDDLKLCNNDLFLQYILYNQAENFNLSKEENKLLYSSMKSYYKENMSRQSLNLAFDNAWGLYQGERVIHPLIFLDKTFFEN